MDDHPHQYDTSMADLCRQLMNGRPPHLIPPISPPADMFSSHRNFSPGGGQQQYELMIASRQVGDIIPLSGADSTAVAAAANTANITVGFEAEAGFFNGGGDGGTGRWPRQETLTLLEIRSRLDSKFKEANQKGPLWDEISRIMSEEHGYQRSGKKCREKFENLYKYYKKTKDGKAGRQDGKHYRFFRQLEALYGDSSTSNTPASVHENKFDSNSTNSFRYQTENNFASTNHEAMQPQRQWDSLSLSNSFGLESSSSEDNDLSSSSVKENESSERRRKRRSPSKWRAKIKEFIDTQMRKLIEKQEAWFERMMMTLEQKEKERLRREEEWKIQEAARLESEHKFWAKERAWIEARDAALMDALHRFTGRDINAMTSNSEEIMATEHGNDQTLNNNNTTSNEERWSDSEITRLIELRTGMESRIQLSGGAEELIWEDIATRMACLGYNKNSVMCKEKWDSICSDYTRRSRTEINKKRKDHLSSNSYFQNDNFVYTQGGELRHDITRLQTIDGSSPSSCNVVNVIPDNCLRFLMGDGETLWENYGLKLNKGDN